MRFVVDEAMWLPEYVRDRLHTEVSLNNKNEPSPETKKDGCSL